uniref:Uncharacterized protein n=1 Tax=Panagrolaimus sp. PS1159 TaxID=55785 RepID=A0AC35FGW6_9BILA
MKFIAIVALLLCISIVFGIKCLQSGDGSSTVECNTKYCFIAHVNGNHNGYTGSQTFQGCGNEADSYVQEFGAKTCDEYGTGTQKKSRGQLHADLYCCDTDLCNSATTSSFLGICVFVVFIKLYFS